jgi:hypothetical protein
MLEDFFQFVDHPSILVLLFFAPFPYMSKISLAFNHIITHIMKPVEKKRVEKL